MRRWIALVALCLVACGGRSDREVEPAPPVAPIARPAAEGLAVEEAEPETEAVAEASTEEEAGAAAEAEAETEPETVAEPEASPAPRPSVRTKRAGTERTSSRDSDFCRRARARDATETVCDAEGNCNSPGVPPQCR